MTFSPSTYYDNEPNGANYPNFSGDYITNFTPGGSGSTYVNPVTINFTSIVTGAAFAMAADGTPYTFTAELNGTVVDQQTISVTYNVSQDFFGFQNEKFNSIIITQAGAGGGPYYDLDNLQIQGFAVPEPTSLAMVSCGISVVLAWTARRRSAISRQSAVANI